MQGVALDKLLDCGDRLINKFIVLLHEVMPLGKAVRVEFLVVMLADL